jgi:predicted ferric reductase
MRHILYGAVWIGVYLALVGGPLLVLMIGSVPPGRGFWREMSVGLGFAGLSMMGFQFFLTGRFQRITSPYGIDVVYHFHKQVSLIAFLFVFLHLVILLTTSPAVLSWLNPFSAPLQIQAGMAGLLAMILLVVLSLKRKSFRLKYEQWRISHGLLAVAAVGFSLWHIEAVGYYVQGALKRGFWIALVGGWVLALLYVRIGKPLFMLRRPYAVHDVIKERGSTWTLVLKPEGHAGMRFKPGQFAWLKLGTSPFAAREHPFSFSSSAMRSDRIDISIKELGDFTSQIGTVTPGTKAYMDGPYGTFTIDRHVAPGYVFVAGGVGITPVVSILRTLADRQDQRALLLFYSSKLWDDVTFREELDDLKQRLDLKIVYVISNPPDDWKGEKGLISAEIMARHLPLNRQECEYFICGPELMQKEVKNSLEKLGISLDSVQSESFNFV